MRSAQPCVVIGSVGRVLAERDVDIYGLVRRWYADSYVDEYGHLMDDANDLSIGHDRDVLTEEGARSLFDDHARAAGWLFAEDFRMVVDAEQ
jgi:hypothetical protein